MYENSNTNARTQVQEQRGRDLAEAVENAQSGKAVEYERLQQEFADYKRRVNLLVQREYALQEARAKLSRTRNGTGSSASDGKVVSDSELNVTAPRRVRGVRARSARTLIISLNLSSLISRITDILRIIHYYHRMLRNTSLLLCMACLEAVRLRILIERFHYF